MARRPETQLRKTSPWGSSKTWPTALRLVPKKLRRQKKSPVLHVNRHPSCPAAGKPPGARRKASSPPATPRATHRNHTGHAAARLPPAWPQKSTQRNSRGLFSGSSWTRCAIGATTSSMPTSARRLTTSWRPFGASGSPNGEVEDALASRWRRCEGWIGDEEQRASRSRPASRTD